MLSIDGIWQKRRGRMRNHRCSISDISSCVCDFLFNSTRGILKGTRGRRLPPLERHFNNAEVCRQTFLDKVRVFHVRDCLSGVQSGCPFGELVPY